MPTIQSKDLLSRLCLGRFDAADVSYLEQVKAADLVAELSIAYPVRFQERRTREKWEVGLAHSVRHRLVFRAPRASLFMAADVVPVSRHCLMLSGEGDRVTGWSFTPRIQTRRVSRPPRGVRVATSPGFKWERFPDGWDVKPLPKKTVLLTVDFLRQRGWRFDELQPPFQTFSGRLQP